MMEEWQKKHIKKNMVELIKLTTCSTLLITQLSTTDVLGEDDVKELELSKLTTFQKSKRLFEILVTRVGAYDHLLKSLEDTQQSGALEVLKAHSALFRSFGSITYDENHVLGTGSSGTKVFKGEFGGRDVAVKVLHTYLISPAVAVREVNMLKNLDHHQNIIRYFTAESQANFICIALELCVISLQNEVKMNLVNMDKFDILKQCTTGLSHLHQNKVIHGDLKPANILLNRHQQVKLSDFGIAKQIQPDRTSVSTANVGTLDYLAPEILKPVLEAEGISVKVKMSNSADVFSLGCVFHFVLTSGVHPFGEIHYLRLPCILQHQHTIFEDIADQWKNAIVKMISHAPSERPSVAMVLSTFSTAPNCAPKSEAIGSQPEETPKITEQSRPFVDRTIKSVSKSNPSTFEPNRKMFENTILANQDGMVQNSARATVVSAAPKNPQSTSSIDSKSKAASTNSPFIVKPTPQMLPTTPVIPRKMTPPHASHSAVPAKPQHFTESQRGLGDSVKISKHEPVKLNQVNEDGNNAVFCAVKSGESMARIRHLVESGVDWKGKNKKGEMILHVAARIGHVEAIHYFVSLGARAEIHSRDAAKNTPLLISSFAVTNFKKTVLVLIENGSDENEVDGDEKNLVLLAVERGRTRSELEFLVNLGISWKKTGIYRNRNVLHIAASAGNVEAVNYFISLGADIHVKDNEMTSPLFCAAEAKKNFKEVVNALVKAGCDINAVDQHGSNLVHVATREGRSSGELKEIVKLGVPWQSKDKRNQTALHRAAMGGNLDAAKYFISLGADGNSENSDGRTPLHYVCWAKENFEEIVTLLITNGAQINATDKHGETLLDIIVKYRKYNQVERIAFVEKMGGVRRKT